MHLSHTVDSNGVELEILDCTAVVGSFTVGVQKYLEPLPPFAARITAFHF
jgi:hypothetical protein